MSDDIPPEDTYKRDIAEIYEAFNDLQRLINDIEQRLKKIENWFDLLHILK